MKDKTKELENQIEILKLELRIAQLEKELAQARNFAPIQPFSNPWVTPGTGTPQPWITYTDTTIPTTGCRVFNLNNPSKD